MSDSEPDEPQKPKPDPDEPKPIPDIYEPNECAVGGFFKNILINKYKIIDIYNKYMKDNNVKFNAREISMRHPDVQGGISVVYVPFDRSVKPVRIFNGLMEVGKVKIYVYFYLLKFSVLHKDIGRVEIVCRNHINRRTYVWKPLITNMRIRIVLLNWKNLCNFDTSKGGRRPYQEYIPIDVLLEDINAPIESAFKKDFQVIHSQIYEIRCDDKQTITQEELAFICPINLDTCLIERKEPPIGNILADGYFYRVEFVEYVQSFQQQVYWKEAGYGKYSLGTDSCDLNRDISHYYAGTSIIGDVMMHGYLYSDSGEQVVNVNEYVDDVKEELLNIV
jgi:hypothetical protein